MFHFLSVITMTTATVLTVTASISDCLNRQPAGCNLPPDLSTGGVLQIKNARINRLSAGVFLNYGHVKTLDLANNNISIVEPGAFVGMAAMTKLLLVANGLQTVRYTTFAGAEKLRYLNLARNRIDRIEPGSFDGLRRLMLLNLNSNRLRVVPANVYDGSPHLHYLYMDGNLIDSIAPTAFQTLTELKVLRLNRNKLESIPDIFGEVLTLTRLGISWNPFQCDCRMELFRRWTRAQGSVLVSSVIRDPVVCRGPPHLAGRDLRYETEAMTCTRPFLSKTRKPAVSVFEGEDKVIESMVKGQPTPSVVWSNPSGSPIPSLSVDSQSDREFGGLRETERVTIDAHGSLVLSRVSMDDSGSYTCRATNIAGSVSFVVDVSVQKNPYDVTTAVATADVDNFFGDKDEQFAEGHDGILEECFDPRSMLAKGTLFACLVTFLTTTLVLTAVFCCFHRRVIARSKTFLGNSRPIPEGHRIGFAKSSFFESESESLRTVVTRLSAMSSGTDNGDGNARRPPSQRSNSNSYCSGSQPTAQRSVDTNDASSKDEAFYYDAYEHPYSKASVRVSDLPPLPQEPLEVEGYMVPSKANLRTMPSRTYQNSTLDCGVESNYATIDQIASRDS